MTHRTKKAARRPPSGIGNRGLLSRRVAVLALDVLARPAIGHAPGRLATAETKGKRHRDRDRTQRSGADPAEVSFAGPGKRDAELRQAVAAGVR